MFRRKVHLNRKHKGLIFYSPQEHGMVPNGGRTYYLNRSQPPMLLQMANDYLEATSDEQLIRENLCFFEQEYSYWCENHTITVILEDGRQHRMFR